MDCRDLASACSPSRLGLVEVWHGGMDRRGGGWDFWSGGILGRAAAMGRTGAYCEANGRVADEDRWT
jgi:hypothetical protein